MDNKTNSYNETPNISHEGDYFIQGEKASVIGIVGNIFLAAGKIAAGILGNSTAMIADGAHSVSDIVSSVVVLLSLNVVKKPADEGHQYGHGKAESIATTIVGIFLLITGFFIAYTAIVAIVNGNIVKPGLLPLIAAIISIISKESMFQYTYRIGKKIGSPSTIANAWHHRSDAYSSIASLIGIIGARFGILILDPIAGIGVTIFIIKMGWDITKEGINQLMDGFDNEQVLEGSKEIITNCEGVSELINIKARQSGPFIFIDVIIGVDREMSVEESHNIAVNIKEKIKDKYDKVSNVLVHVDPVCLETTNIHYTVTEKLS